MNKSDCSEEEEMLALEVAEARRQQDVAAARTAELNARLIERTALRVRIGGSKSEADALTLFVSYATSKNLIPQNVAHVCDILIRSSGDYLIGLNSFAFVRGKDSYKWEPSFHIWRGVDDRAFHNFILAKTALLIEQARSLRNVEGIKLTLGLKALREVHYFLFLRLYDDAQFVFETEDRMLLMDMDPGIMPLRDGLVYDFRQRRAREAVKEDNVTVRGEVSYIPAEERDCAENDLGLKFMRDISLDREDLSQFLMKLCGYFCTGWIQRREWYLAVGHGRNGKSQLIEVLCNILGPNRCTGIKSGRVLLDLMSTDPGKATTNFNDVHGKTFFPLSELCPAMPIDNELVKRASGDGDLQLRRQHAECHNEKVMFKMFVGTNNIPKMSAEQAMRDRTVIIPFDARFGGSNKESRFYRPLDPQMGEKLKCKKVLSCLFSNFVDAFTMDFLNPLEYPPPACVQENTEVYMDDLDVYQMFFHERIQLNKDAALLNTELCTAFAEWFTEKEHCKAPHRTTISAKFKGMHGDPGKGGPKGKDVTFPGWQLTVV